MKDLLLSVWNIFTYTGRLFTFIRNIFLNFLLLLICVTVVFVLIPSKEAKIPSGSILRLDISGDIVEEKKLLGTFEKLLQDALAINSPAPETALQDILDIIHEATEDNRIVAMVLNVKDMGRGGMNQLQTIGEALNAFKKTGKTVVAAEDYYTQSQYFLASYADKVLVNPMGGVDIHGIGVYRLYFKDAVEKLEINYNVFKIGSYKSALEPFTRNSMSPADKQQNELWLSALWQVYTDGIAQQRNIPVHAVQYYTDNIDKALYSTKGNTAQLALETGLVDQIATRQETTTYLASLSPTLADSPQLLASMEYLNSITPSFTPEKSPAPKVGLIIAEGKILPGKQPPGMIGGDSLANLIKKAREDSAVKALVLRISSGGGSAFASEVIRQEILELKRSGKPIVVSMGSIAASGGYWIAADADEIWASPATITGSIGIFGAIPTFENTLASLGVYRDGIGTTPLAAGLDVTQPLPDQLKSAIQQTIVYNYNQFLEIVADGRHLEKTSVAELAQGRVYDGQTAQTLGLVDKLGSLENAISSAAELAGLTMYRTEYIQPPVSMKEHLLQFFSSGPAFLADTSVSHHPVVIRFQKIFLNHLDKLPLLDDPRGIYAQCLLNLTW